MNGGIDRDSYYEVLEKSQKGGCDITTWLIWFLQMYVRAIEGSQETIKKALLVAKFWQRNNQIEINERQIKVTNQLLEAEPMGFEGGLTNRKYVSLTKVSRETAKRDLGDLEKKGILKRISRGRSVSFSLNLEFL